MDKNVNVIYKGITTYLNVSLTFAECVSDKDDFRCFEYEHRKNDKMLPITKIRMITFTKSNIIYGEWR